MSAIIAAPLAPLPQNAPSGIPTSPVSDPATFRSHFPEFSDTSTYPDSSIQFWLDMGAAMTSPIIWGSMQQQGSELFAAHMLALGRYAALGAGATGVPGLARGIMNSKSVSKVSVGYDTASVALEGGGPWNYTVYGQQYLWMARLAGTGGYETLSIAPGNSMVGICHTWSRGVMMRWGS